MVKYKSGKLSKKEQAIINDILIEKSDIYKDFYITRSNLRLFIIDNPHLLYDCLAKGDGIVYSPDEGMIFVTGFSDNGKRIYIKPLVENAEAGDRLLKVLLWNVKNIDLYAKIKKNNPIKSVLLRNSFSFLGDRGKEILLKRQYIQTKFKNNKEVDNDNRN